MSEAGAGTDPEARLRLAEAELRVLRAANSALMAATAPLARRAAVVGERTVWVGVEPQHLTRLAMVRTAVAGMCELRGERR